MSGEESLAQVYREIESPKLPNLKKAGLVIFLYSLLFTSLVSIFAVMIIPDGERHTYFQNLISGLAMNLYGPYGLRLLFHAFVVIVGVLILPGAVNTAIVGSNGVLNRVSEDGVLPDWFRQPHRQFRNDKSNHQHGGFLPNTDDHHQPRRGRLPRKPLCVWRDLEFRDEGAGGARAALHASRRARIPGSDEFQRSETWKFRLDLD